MTKELGDPTAPFSLLKAVGPARSEKVEALFRSDWTLKDKRHLFSS